MAWGKKVQCYGFPEEWLPAIKYAIENKQVKWGESSGFCESFPTAFTWANASWQLNEMTEVVESIWLRRGKVDEEALTVAMLRG